MNSPNIFNAWRDPWVPVVPTTDKNKLVSLRDLFAEAHTFRRFGDGLTPLDLDSLYRLTTSLGAVIARRAPDESYSDQRLDHFPTEAVDSVGNEFGDLFDLIGTKNGSRPFLQRHDKTPDDVKALVSGKKTITDIIKPIEQLLPHEPGDSTSQWAVRRDQRQPTDWATLTLLLTTAWFQTKNGNARDPWGGKHLKGSAGTWHTNPLAVHLVNRNNLAQTILANMPGTWIEHQDLPAFLARNDKPDGIATMQKESVYRFSYAKTLPLVVCDDKNFPIGFVVGEDTSIEIPLLESTPKKSLDIIHEHDHTRLYITKVSKNGKETLLPRGSFGTRLSSLEGFERWFRAEYGISAALQNQKPENRVYTINDPEWSNWHLAIYSETTDGKGTRNWTDWSEIPEKFATATGDRLAAIRNLLTFASTCRSKLHYGLKIASQEGQTAAQTDTARAALYSRLEPTFADVMAHFEKKPDETNLEQFAKKMRQHAIEAFNTTTKPLATPQNVAHVANAQSWYRRTIFSEFKKTYPQNEEHNND